jgi:hypothetical protein
MKERESMICKICGLEATSFCSHLKVHELTKEEYYLKYVSDVVPICVNYDKNPDCKKDLKLISINHGYYKYCSKECFKKYAKGIKRTKRDHSNEIKWKESMIQFEKRWSDDI